VVLLVSKAYSYPKHIIDNYDSETNRLQLLTNCQRKLAEITDMVHVSQVLHRGVVDLSISSSADDGIDAKLREDLHLGNTISVLIGDFLLAQSSRGLALIRNPSVSLC
jgi:geranylgeranyl pyrophosphate synthase